MDDQSIKLDLSRIVIKQIKSEEATKEFWEKYHQFNEKCFKEIFPNDSLPGREVIEKDILTAWPGYHTFYWAVFENSSEEKIIARSIFSYNKEDSPGYEENKHNSYFYIIVDGDYRRRGLGTHLLKLITEKIQEKGCKYTETRTYYDSGRSFCLKHGGRLINESSENRLQLEDVDWAMVNSWREEGKQRAPAVTLERFSITPEKDISEICALETELENQVPTLEEGDEKWIAVFTPEKRREREGILKGFGQELVTIITREANGIISGITEIRHSHIEQIERVAQGLTGVKKEYRGRGLGKWLKAEMLVFIKNNLPKAKYIATGNANHNEPMLSINNRLGFKPYCSESSYKFRLSDLLKRFEKNVL